MSIKMITIVSLSLILIGSFLVWHFCISIYEVRYSYPQGNNILLKNNNYSIECYGINSLGNELKWRKILSTVEILDGEDLAKITEVKNNRISFSTNSIVGKVVLKINSELSLNPALLTFTVKD